MGFRLDDESEDDVRETEDVAAKIAQFVALVFALIIIGFLWFRLLVPMVWEIGGDGGHIIAFALIALGIVGLVSAAIWGRRALLSPKRQPRKSRKAQ